MQTCPGCGYLVPDGWAACKRCGASLARAAAPLPDEMPTLDTRPPAREPTTASPPGAPSAAVASATGGWDAPARVTHLRGPALAGAGALATPPPVPPGRAAGARWVPPEPPEARAAPASSRFLLLVALVVVGTLAVGWTVWYTALRSTPAASRPAVPVGADGSSTPAPEVPVFWIGFTPHDGSFTVRLPSEPVTVNVPMSIANVNLDIAGYVSQGRADHELVFVETADLPAQVVPDGPTAVRQVLAGMAGSSGGRLTYQRLFTVNSDAAADAEVRGPKGVAEVRVIADGTRIYILTVDAPHAQLDDFQTLVGSFSIAAPTGLGVDGVGPNGQPTAS